MGDQKTKIMFICSTAPYGTIYEQEAIEAMIMFSSYEQDISVAFIGDGVFSLKKGQDPSLLNIKNFTQTYLVIKDDFEVSHLYVEKESLKERGLDESDLITEVEVLDRNVLRQKMDEMKALLPF
ncbi:MAG: sulfurtransferase complex subunit TusC [Deltaproteobacteria bacterium]|nr:sulfurtransferase complex subunit TusC [Deltaproteobacteria bacterium]